MNDLPTSRNMSQRPARPTARRGIVGVLAAGLALMMAVTVTACTSSKPSSRAAEPSVNAGYLATAGKQLTALYKGTYTKPTGPKVDSKRGENVWVISPGESTEAAHNLSSAVQQAGRSLGWNVTIFDGKDSPTTYVPGIQQALAAKADAIIVSYIDCAGIRTGLQEAKQANVPVVAVESSDCNQVSKDGPQLFNWVVTYGDNNEPFRQWTQDWGRAQGTWLIAKTNGRANVVLSVETDLTTTDLTGTALKEQLHQCAGCTVHWLPFVSADLGTALSQKISQALLQYPDVNSFIAAYDAVLTLGGATALKASGRHLYVVGGEGSAPGIQLIREGQTEACSGIPTAWEGYAAVDAVTRNLAHQDPAEARSGIGLQVCDAQHNLPPAGQPYQPPVDFRAAYHQMWGIS